MIHNSTINRSQLNSLSRYDDKIPLNSNDPKIDIDELKKSLKSSQKIIVNFLYLLLLLQ